MSSQSDSLECGPYFQPEPENMEEFETIFVRSYRHKNGKLMVASQYGLKAFVLRVRKRS